MRNRLIAQVGVANTLRAEVAPAGVFNASEFGSAATEEGFRWLLDEDAYLHVQDGVNMAVANGTLIVLVSESSTDATYQTDSCATANVNVGGTSCELQSFDTCVNAVSSDGSAVTATVTGHYKCCG